MSDIYCLSHAGVKGMKWGVRKAQRKAEKQAARVSKQEAQDARRAAAGKTKTKGQRIAGRIIRGVATDIGITAIGFGAQKALLDRGHESAALIVGLGATGASVANAVNTVRDSVRIGKDKRDRW